MLAIQEFKQKSSCLPEKVYMVKRLYTLYVKGRKPYKNDLFALSFTQEADYLFHSFVFLDHDLRTLHLTFFLSEYTE